MTQRTGIRPFSSFISKSELGGLRYIRDARLLDEYKSMTCAELSRRIQADIDELEARAAPVLHGKYGTNFTPVSWNENSVRRSVQLRNIDEKLINEVRPGLWSRLMSKDAKVKSRATNELERLVETHKAFEPMLAESALAQIRTNLNTKLDYLSKGPLPAGRKAFHKAAVSLLSRLIWMKRKPSWYFNRKTAWRQNLLALPLPMSAANWHEWWKVAKVWIDELWDEDPDQFQLLMKHRGLDPKRHTPSLIKSRVVDDSLKKAFKALAVPAVQ